MRIISNMKIITVCCVAFLSIYAMSAYAEDVTAEAQVIVEDQGIKISVTDYEYSTSGTEQAEFHVIVENGTDKDLTIRAQDVSVNGYMLDPYWRVDVEAHNSINDSIEFFAFRLEELGIEKIAEVEVSFAAFSDDNEEPDFVTAPGKITTSAFDSYYQEYDDSGEVLIDDEKFKVVAKELSTNEFGAFQYFYIENNTDRKVHLCASEITANSKPVPGLELNYSDIGAGKKDREAINFTNSDLRKAGVKSLESVGANLTFFDAETREVLLSRTISIGGDTEGLISAPPTISGVAYNDDFVEISVGDFSANNIGDSTLPISIKNRSSDTLIYSFRGLRVNGRDIDGYSGKSFSFDYNISIKPLDTYETTLGIRRDSLRENGITNIEKIEADMTFMNFKAVIHDITLDVPFSEENSADTSLVSLSKNSNDYAYKMFHFIGGGDKLYILYELTNPNDSAVHLKGTLKFKDKDGKVLDTASDVVQYINPNRFNFMIFSTEKTETTDVTLNVEPSVCLESEKADYSYDIEEIEGGGIKVSVTNNENVDAIVQLTVFLTKNGSIVGFRRGFGNGVYETVPAGGTVEREISDIEFDDRTVYITALKE